MAFKSTLNTGLPNIPDPPDPAFMAEFIIIYNAIRNIAIALDSYTGAIGQDAAYYSQTTPAKSILTQNSHRLYVQFGATVTAGQTVHLYNSSGVLNAEPANATTGTKPCHGWCSVGGIAGSWGEVILGGLWSGTFTPALIPGTTYYQSNTDGTIGTSAGTSVQRIGFALSTTDLFMNPALV